MSAHARLAAYIAEHCPTALASTNTYGDLDNVLDLVADALEEYAAATPVPATSAPLLEAAVRLRGTIASAPTGTSFLRGFVHGLEQAAEGLESMAGTKPASTPRTCQRTTSCFAADVTDGTCDGCGGRVQGMGVAVRPKGSHLLEPQEPAEPVRATVPCDLCDGFGSLARGLVEDCGQCGGTGEVKATSDEEGGRHGA